MVVVREGDGQHLLAAVGPNDGEGERERSAHPSCRCRSAGGQQHLVAVVARHGSQEGGEERAQSAPIVAIGGGNLLEEAAARLAVAARLACAVPALLLSPATMTGEGERASSPAW